MLRTYIVQYPAFPVDVAGWLVETEVLVVVLLEAVEGVVGEVGVVGTVHPISPQELTTQHFSEPRHSESTEHATLGDVHTRGTYIEQEPGLPCVVLVASMVVVVGEGVVRGLTQ